MEYKDYCLDRIGNKQDLRLELNRLYEFSQVVEDKTTLEFIDNRYVILKCVKELLLHCPFLDKRKATMERPCYLDILELVDRLNMGGGMCYVFCKNKYWRDFWGSLGFGKNVLFRGSYIPLFDVSPDDAYNFQCDQFVTYINDRVELLEKCLKYNKYGENENL